MDNKVVRVVLPVVTENMCPIHLLTRAVDSVAIQTYDHNLIQLVIAWDGWSFERVMSEIQPCLSFENPLSVLFEEPVGVSRARNAALHFKQHADPQYVCYLDADNIMLPDFIESMVKAMDERGDEDCVIYCKQKLYYHSKTGIRLPDQFSYRGMAKHINSAEAFRLALYRGNWIDMGTIMHKYHCSIQFDPDLERLVDWDLLLSLAVTRRFYPLDKVLSVYNANANIDSISNTASFSDNFDKLRKKWNDVYM